MEHIINPAGIIKSKQGRIRITPLLFELAEIDTTSQNTRRRASLEPLKLDTCLLKRTRKPFRRDIAHPATLIGVLAHVHQATQKGPRSDHHRPRIEIYVEVGAHAHHTPAFIDKPLNHRLKQVEIGLKLEYVLHPVLIRLLITLRTWRLHRRAL